MKHLFALLSLIGCIAICDAKTYTPSSVPNPKQNGQEYYVSNPDHILSEEVVADLNMLCRMLEDSTDVELAIVAIDNKGDYEMFEFGYELFELWGIGKEGKNTGLLVTLSKETHDVFINTGTGIEGIMTDAECRRIVDEVMIPYFKTDDYNAGIMMGAMQIYETCTQGDAPEELLNMQSVANTGGYLTASQRAEQNTLWHRLINSQWIIWSLITFAILLPFLLLILYQGPEQTAIAELEQREGCKSTMIILYIFWPFAIPACIWFAFRSKMARCPKCGKKKMHFASETKLKEPTYTEKGRCRKVYRCSACGYEESVEKDIPVLGSSGSGSGSGSGGRGGGSFGGGHSSGGGGGGHW